MKIQDADAIKSQISNIELLQQLETIQNIDDPAQRAELYKKYLVLVVKILRLK